MRAWIELGLLLAGCAAGAALLVYLHEWTDTGLRRIFKVKDDEC